MTQDRVNWVGSVLACVRESFNVSRWSFPRSKHSGMHGER